MQGVTFCNSGISGKIHVWTWPKLHTPREYHGQQCMTRKCHQFPLEGPKIGPQNQHFFSKKKSQKVTPCMLLRLACKVVTPCMLWEEERRAGAPGLLTTLLLTTKIHKYTNTQKQHTSQTQLGSNRCKKLRLACKIKPCL